MGAKAAGKMDMNQLPKIQRTRGRKKRVRKSNQWRFDIYIRRINRMMNAGTTIRRDSMTIINDLLLHFAHRICKEAKVLCRLSGRKTLHAKDLDTAVKIVLGPKAMYAHSNLECRKALLSFGISHAS